MELGILGLGKMGLGIATRLIKSGYTILGYDKNPDRCHMARDKGIWCSEDLPSLAASLSAPRIVWLMLPAGQNTDEAIVALSELLNRGDIIIDGANSHYRDTVSRAEKLQAAGISLLDVGVSGGVHGEDTGYCLMVGGDKTVFEHVEPLFRDLACSGGYAFLGPAGAGHFAKMVHNAIEYVFLQGLGEGFELLRNSDYEYDLASVANLWNNGSVIRSWLLELTAKVFQDSNDLGRVRGWIADSGEARWAVEDALKRDVPLPATAISLMMRLRSRQEDSFSAKLIAKLREAFGGHEVKTK